MFFELFVIFFLLFLNGVFALAEIAVVSSRKARLQVLADQGSANAAAALALIRDPTRFLSTVQIGITLVGILAGAFGGATFSQDLAVYIETVPGLAGYAEPLAMLFVVGVITYFSLVMGELVPKRIALSDPEARAMLVARPMALLSRAASPFVWFLTVSTNAMLRVFGLGAEKEKPPTEEEIAHMIEQGTTAGVFHKAERAMVEGVLKLDELPVTEIMTRRTKIVWLNVADPDEVNWRKIVASGHSHFPVYEGQRDHIIGMVSVKSLWANSALGVPTVLRNHLVKPLVVPTTITALQLLESFQKTGKHLALVSDEFGSIQGVASLIDVMEAIVGSLPEMGRRVGPSAVQRDDGSWLVDGTMEIGDVRRQFGVPSAARAKSGAYETLGGFMIHRLGHIPNPGEHFDEGGWRFEVVDMDRHRVDKVLLVPPKPPAAAPAAAS